MMVGMHIHVIPNRGSRPTVLVRQSYREGKKIRKRTLANLSKLPREHVEVLRRLLRGEKLVAPEEALTIERSLAHGHVKAVRNSSDQLWARRQKNGKHV